MRSDGPRRYSVSGRREQGMIAIKTKIHDRFSVEFKVGFVTEDRRDNDFVINTWLFLPDSLDINPSTYGKEDFYRDVKSNVRFITPVFDLHDIADGEAIPLSHIRTALRRLAAEPSHEHEADCEFHIKMYAAIVKSALREAVNRIEACDDPQLLDERCVAFARDARRTLQAYRQVGEEVASALSEAARHYFAFGDEYMSYCTSGGGFRILARLDRMERQDAVRAAREAVTRLIREESRYKQQAGFPTVSSDDPASNRWLVYRQGILKKYISSDLYIRLVKKEDGRTVRQLYASIAAGLAMVFATVVAFAFQKRFGNFSGPLFVALVVSYMLKDRIKELMRYFFAYRLRHRYFDHKAVIHMQEQPIGWLKEGMDFIPEEKVPAEVIELRGRTPLAAVENRLTDEKIILFRKLVHIDGDELARYNVYRLSGINDILRIHIGRFMQKMDDPQVPLRRLRDDGTTETVYTDKIYYINFVMQFVDRDQTLYKRFRLEVTREGIQEIREMK